MVFVGVGRQRTIFGKVVIWIRRSHWGADPSLQSIWSIQNGLNELKKKTITGSWIHSTRVYLGKVREGEINIIKKHCIKLPIYKNITF